MWDRATLRPVQPAIVWQDRRTAALCDALANRGLGARRARADGPGAGPLFLGHEARVDPRSGPRRSGGARAGGLAFGTVDCVPVARLTGGPCTSTDRTNASRTMLFDIRRWPGTTTPRAASASRPRCSRRCGLVRPVRHDRPGRFLGAAGPDPRRRRRSAGVALRPGLLRAGPDEEHVRHGGLRADAYRRSGAGLDARACSRPWPRAPTTPVAYALEGAIFVTGAAIQWLRDGLGLIDRASDAGPLAASVPDAGGVFVVPALTGLGAPWWDPYARGTICAATSIERTRRVWRLLVARPVSFMALDEVRRDGLPDRATPHSSAVAITVST